MAKIHILQKWLRRWLGIPDYERQIETLTHQVRVLTRTVEALTHAPLPREAAFSGNSLIMPYPVVDQGAVELTPPLDEVRRLRWEKRRDTTFRIARRQFLQRKGEL